MRKLTTLLMAITIIFTLSCPAFAATIEMAKTTAETMRGKQIEANINDLLESYKTTNDAAKQTAIFNELVGLGQCPVIDIPAKPSVIAFAVNYGRFTDELPNGSACFLRLPFQQQQGKCFCGGAGRISAVKYRLCHQLRPLSKI